MLGRNQGNPLKKPGALTEKRRKEGKQARKPSVLDWTDKSKMTFVETENPADRKFDGEGSCDEVAGTYSGQFKDGAFNGQGAFEFSSSGDKYDGQWEDGIKHGAGKYMYPSGNSYDGEWIDGQMHGEGTFIWSTGGIGSLVVPELKNGGSMYTGSWAEGLRHGQGTHTFASGAVYEGSWESSKYHGYGKLSFANGERYEGQFENGKQHGRGVLYSSYGTVKYDGAWRNGREAEGMD